jgi:hypothetical protein
MIASVLIDRDSDSGSSTRSEQATNNRAGTPSARLLEVGAPRNRQESKTCRYADPILWLKHWYPSQVAGNRIREILALLPG